MFTDLRLQHFRSYKDASFEINPGVNIIVGPNASGKTNLLEAVLVLARGGSYRAKDQELVRFGRPWARLDGHTHKNTARTVKLVNQLTSTKSFEIDGKTLSRLSLNSQIPTVLFEPNHLRLLTGGPEARRDYLDDLLEQTVSGYATTRRQYRRALAQRNALLKQFPANRQKVFPWDVRLSQLAGQIVRARQDLIDKIGPGLPKLYKQLSQTKTKVNLSYGSRWPITSYESQLLKKLEQSFEDDRLRGFTGYGPHREDLLLTFDGHLASQTASRGELRTAVLALKISELQLIEAQRGTPPILLLDDVFSELDGRRRHALTDYLSAYQTFITTTDADLVVKHFTKKSHVIPLR